MKRHGTISALFGREVAASEIDTAPYIGVTPTARDAETYALRLSAAIAKRDELTHSAPWRVTK